MRIFFPILLSTFLISTFELRAETVNIPIKENPDSGETKGPRPHSEVEDIECNYSDGMIRVMLSVGCPNAVVTLEDVFTSVVTNYSIGPIQSGSPYSFPVGNLAGTYHIIISIENTSYEGWFLVG